ncbi:MAG: hypothetical protein ABI042_18470, partial [Verrucomicrobiota bacterium]
QKSVTTFTATLPPLRLGIARTNGNVTLSWPVGAAGFVLQMTDQLTTSVNWTAVTNTALVVGEQKTVTLQPTSGTRFYQLRKP